MRFAEFNRIAKGKNAKGKGRLDLRLRSVPDMETRPW